MSFQVLKEHFFARFSRLPCTSPSPYDPNAARCVKFKYSSVCSGCPTKTRHADLYAFFLCPLTNFLNVHISILPFYCYFKDVVWFIITLLFLFSMSFNMCRVAYVHCLLRV